MHRTTISLEGPVERELKKLAHKEMKSLSEVLNELVRKGLASTVIAGQKKPSFIWTVSDATPSPDFDPSDRSTYLESINRRIP